MRWCSMPTIRVTTAAAARASSRIFWFSRKQAVEQGAFVDNGCDCVPCPLRMPASNRSSDGERFR